MKILYLRYFSALVMTGLLLLSQTASSATVNVLETYFGKSTAGGAFTLEFQYDDAGLLGSGREYSSVNFVELTLISQFGGSACCLQPQTIIYDTDPDAIDGARWNAVIDNGVYTGLGQGRAGVHIEIPNTYGPSDGLRGLNILFTADWAVTPSSGGSIIDDCHNHCRGGLNAWFVKLDENDQLIQPVVSAVPVPAAVWLFGSGLIGLAGIARRKN